jgi:uncharacterized coiled-coil protein SlyX
MPENPPLSDPLPLPMGAVEARIRALEKIQADQTVVLESMEKRLTAAEKFILSAQEMAQKIHKKSGGFFGSMFRVEDEP